MRLSPKNAVPATLKQAKKGPNPGAAKHHTAGHQWRSALARMEGAYSANTIRSYRADFAIFEAWCQQERRSPTPAPSKTGADFVLAQAKSGAPATISRRRAAIAKIHRLLKLDSP